MATTGMKARSKAQQAVAARLGEIIDEFGHAMWNARRAYIATPPECKHDDIPRFTFGMEAAWAKYVEFCKENPND